MKIETGAEAEYLEDLIEEEEDREAVLSEVRTMPAESQLIDFEDKYPDKTPSEIRNQQEENAKWSESYTESIETVHKKKIRIVNASPHVSNEEMGDWLGEIDDTFTVDIYNVKPQISVVGDPTLPDDEYYNAYGLYDPEEKKVYLGNMQGLSNTEKKRHLAHEVGHHVIKHVLYNRIKNKKARVAVVDLEEDMAEMFSRLSAGYSNDFEGAILELSIELRKYHQSVRGAVLKGLYKW